MIQADVIRNELLNALRHGQIARRVRWDKLHRVRRRSAFPTPGNIAYMQHTGINVYILAAQCGDLAKQQTHIQAEIRRHLARLNVLRQVPVDYTALFVRQH